MKMNDMDNYGIISQMCKFGKILDVSYGGKMINWFWTYWHNELMASDF